MRALCLAALAVTAGAAPPARLPLDADRYLEHVKYLASDQLRGRGTGTPELERAARYLADTYKALGLEPGFGKSYLQPFTITTNAKSGPRNRFQDSITRGKYKSGQDFVPLNLSSSGKASGPVVFAGYGITAAEYQYDDYEGLDVQGKIVLLLRFEPQEFDDNSVLQGRTYTHHAQIDSKAINAKLHGAKGVLLINNPVTHAADAGTLEKFGRIAGPSEAGIPFLQIKPEIARKWFEASGRSLTETIQGIDQDLKPRSFAFHEAVRVEMELDVEREVKTVHNVAAYWPGETDEYVVIGAHYDHLGLGEQFSLSPSQAGQPHYGADDNASGVAGVLELASALRGERRRRGIYFVNFAAEELGLLGSAFFADHPPRPIDQCAAMINLDMIGRMRDNSVIIGGVTTGSSFRALIEEQAVQFPHLKLEYGGQQGVGSSDHTSFLARHVPVLFFFTGLHGDYHRPSDTWDKINAKGAVDLLGLVANTAASLASGPRTEFAAEVRTAKNAGAAVAITNGVPEVAGRAAGEARTPAMLRGPIKGFAECIR
jgi:hypothetical protein